MSARKTAKSELMPNSFELGLEELDALIQKLESGRLPLAEALQHYQRGAGLLVFCQKHLNEAEEQIKVLEDGLLKAFNVEKEVG
jgi:exodeoxyribonuclease VII small subunit